MSLQEKIDQDLKQAMISKNETKVMTIRFLKSALKYSAMEKKQETLSDADIQQVIQKQLKQHKESIDQFTKAKRNDLAEKETRESAILEAYLPQQMPDAELEQFIRREAAAAGVSAKKDFGKAMKFLTEKLSGRANSRRVSEILGKILS